MKIQKLLGKKMKLLYLSNYSGSTGEASTAAGPEQSNDSCKY